MEFENVGLGGGDPVSFLSTTETCILKLDYCQHTLIIHLSKTIFKKPTVLEIISLAWGMKGQGSTPPSTLIPPQPPKTNLSVKSKKTTVKENPFADKGTVVFTLEKVVHSIGSLKKMLELQFGQNLVRIDGEVMATTEKPFKKFH